MNKKENKKESATKLFIYTLVYYDNFISNKVKKYSIKSLFKIFTSIFKRKALKE